MKEKQIMFLNINNDLNYMMQKTGGNPEDRRKYDELVLRF